MNALQFRKAFRYYLCKLSNRLPLDPVRIINHFQMAEMEHIYDRQVLYTHINTHGYTPNRSDLPLPRSVDLESLNDELNLFILAALRAFANGTLVFDSYQERDYFYDHLDNALQDRLNDSSFERTSYEHTLDNLNASRPVSLRLSSICRLMTWGISIDFNSYEIYERERKIYNRQNSVKTPVNSSSSGSSKVASPQNSPLSPITRLIIGPYVSYSADVLKASTNDDAPLPELKSSSNFIPASVPTSALPMHEWPPLTKLPLMRPDNAHAGPNTTQDKPLTEQILYRQHRADTSHQSSSRKQLSAQVKRKPLHINRPIIRSSSGS